MSQMAQDTLTSKVELSISCKNLRDMDVLSKSDPMAVLFQKLNNSYFEVGRTEVIKNNLNPIFAKMFEINYHFEERQLFKVEIYDSDSLSSNLKAHDFLGRYEFSLGEIVSRKKIEVELKDCGTVSKKTRPFVILSCQELSSCKESITLQFSGSKLDKKDIFGKSDPLLEVYRCNEPIKFCTEQSNKNVCTNFSLVYRSKPVMNTLNPSWPSFNVKLTSLCCGDKDRLIKIVCADWDNDGSQDLIGQCFSSVNHLLSNNGRSHAFELINFNKQAKKKGYKNSGNMTLCKADVQVDYTFIDFISGGTELNFTVAIDFTASNGKPSDPRSLHYIPQGDYQFAENQYETAISSIGFIIQDYDYDKMFPALGFGARIPPNSEVSHCFPINFCMENPYCSGVNGLLSTYRSAIRVVKLHGPTNFAPSIRHIQKFAQAYKDGSKYFVLLIITDGIITDLDATVDVIVDCSYLPMSIIIIGVGNEDFSAMDMLDCDNGRLRSGQKVAVRDIVQFVAIRDFSKNSSSGINQAALSKAVLFELPDQVTSWMKANRITPLPTRKTSVPNPMYGDNSQLEQYPPMAAAPHGGPFLPMTNSPQHSERYPPMANTPQHGGQCPPMASVPQYGSQNPPMVGGPQHGSQYPQMTSGPQHGNQYPPMTSVPQHGSQYPQMTSGPQHGNQYPPMGSGPQYGSQYPQMTSGSQHRSQYPPMTSGPQHGNQYSVIPSAPMHPSNNRNPSITTNPSQYGGQYSK